MSGNGNGSSRFRPERGKRGRIKGPTYSFNLVSNIISPSKNAKPASTPSENLSDFLREISEAASDVAETVSNTSESVTDCEEEQLRLRSCYHGVHRYVSEYKKLKDTDGDAFPLPDEKFDFITNVLKSVDDGMKKHEKKLDELAENMQQVEVSVTGLSDRLGYIEQEAANWTYQASQAEGGDTLPGETTMLSELQDGGAPTDSGTPKVKTYTVKLVDDKRKKELAETWAEKAKTNDQGLEELNMKIPQFSEVVSGIPVDSPVRSFLPFLEEKKFHRPGGIKPDVQQRAAYSDNRISMIKDVTRVVNTRARDADKIRQIQDVVNKSQMVNPADRRVHDPMHGEKIASAYLNVYRNHDLWDVFTGALLKKSKELENDPDKKAKRMVEVFRHDVLLGPFKMETWLKCEEEKGIDKRNEWILDLVKQHLKTHIGFSIEKINALPIVQIMPMQHCLLDKFPAKLAVTLVNPELAIEVIEAYNTCRMRKWKDNTASIHVPDELVDRRNALSKEAKMLRTQIKWTDPEAEVDTMLVYSEDGIDLLYKKKGYNWSIHDTRNVKIPLVSETCNKPYQYMPAHHKRMADIRRKKAEVEPMAKTDLSAWNTILRKTKPVTKRLATEVMSNQARKPSFSNPPLLLSANPFSPLGRDSVSGEKGDDDQVSDIIDYVTDCLIDLTINHVNHPSEPARNSEGEDMFLEEPVLSQHIRAAKTPDGTSDSFLCVNDKYVNSLKYTIERVSSVSNIPEHMSFVSHLGSQKLAGPECLRDEIHDLNKSALPSPTWSDDGQMDQVNERPDLSGSPSIHETSLSCSDPAVSCLDQTDTQSNDYDQGLICHDALPDTTIPDTMTSDDDDTETSMEPDTNLTIISDEPGVKMPGDDLHCETMHVRKLADGKELEMVLPSEWLPALEETLWRERDNYCVENVYVKLKKTGSKKGQYFVQLGLRPELEVTGNDHILTCTKVNSKCLNLKALKNNMQGHNILHIAARTFFWNILRELVKTKGYEVTRSERVSACKECGQEDTDTFCAVCRRHSHSTCTTASCEGGCSEYDLQVRFSKDKKVWVNGGSSFQKALKTAMMDSVDPVSSGVIKDKALRELDSLIEKCPMKVIEPRESVVTQSTLASWNEDSTEAIAAMKVRANILKSPDLNGFLDTDLSELVRGGAISTQAEPEKSGPNGGSDEVMSIIKMIEDEAETEKPETDWTPQGWATNKWVDNYGMRYLAPTKTDGGCFYDSLVKCAIDQNILDIVSDSEALRRMIAEKARRLPEAEGWIQSIHNGDRRSYYNYLNHHAKKGTYAEGIIIQAAALILEVRIRVVGPTTQLKRFSEMDVRQDTEAKATFYLALEGEHYRALGWKTKNKKTRDREKERVQSRLTKVQQGELKRRKEKEKDSGGRDTDAMEILLKDLERKALWAEECIRGKDELIESMRVYIYSLELRVSNRCDECIRNNDDDLETAFSARHHVPLMEIKSILLRQQEQLDHLMGGGGQLPLHVPRGEAESVL